MIQYIVGQPAEEGDNDPVEVRKLQIQGSALDYAIGYPQTPVYYDQADDSEQPGHYWQYFDNGVIIWSQNTCAEVLYGPIMDFWGQTGHFKGPLGSSSTDVTQLPDGTFYAAFENGVLWLSAEGTVYQLIPLSPGLVQGFAHVDPTINGITQLAQQKVSAMANNAVRTNASISQYVNSITTTVAFDSVGTGGCTGASFSSGGTSMMRSHKFRIHFDFDLNGCAGAVGSASADMHVTIRLSVNPSGVQALLVTYNIDGVSSPFSVADDPIYNGLRSSFNQQYGHDLLGQSTPPGVNILAALVDTSGNVSIYVERLCATSFMLRRVSQPGTENTLAQIRRLRDEFILHDRHGQDLIQLVDIAGPVIAQTIQQQRDSAALRTAIARLLISTFHEHADLKAIAKQLSLPIKSMHELLTAVTKKGGPEVTTRLISRAVKFIREDVGLHADFEGVMKSLTKILNDEADRVLRGNGDGARRDARKRKR